MGTRTRLNEYLSENSTKIFDIGLHDCLTFTNGAWRVMYGHGFADAVIGKYKTKGRRGMAQLCKDTYGHFNIIKALDENLQRVDGFPPRGSLVISNDIRRGLFDHAFGISNGTNSFFVADRGLTIIQTDQINGAWANE